MNSSAHLGVKRSVRSAVHPVELGDLRPGRQRRRCREPPQRFRRVAGSGGAPVRGVIDRPERLRGRAAGRHLRLQPLDRLRRRGDDPHPLLRLRARRRWFLVGSLGAVGQPNFSACSAAIGDLETGQIDPRAISVLSGIVQTHSIHVCPLKSGHYQCVGGGSLASRPDCTESHHWYGRGVDIGSVDGVAVSSANAGAYAIVQGLTTFPAGDPSRPNVGSPWPEFSALPGFYHDSDHTDHIHLGFCGTRWSGGVWSDSCA